MAEHIALKQEAWSDGAPDLSTPQIETFASPTQNSFTIHLNVDRKLPIILFTPTRQAVVNRFTSFERSFVGEFWAYLSQASKYNCTVPFGLAGSSSGHALIDPGALFHQVTGVSDLSSAEALRCLKHYALTDLQQGIERLFTAYRNWLTWLSTLTIVPPPYAVTRQHISSSDGPSYLNYLATKGGTAHHRNMCLSKISDVFDRLGEETERSGGVFVNPVRYDLDKFAAPRGERSSSTRRRRLSALIQDELKTYIIRQNEKGDYSWSPDLLGLDSIFHLSPEGVRVMCPILPAIIYLLLSYPLRTHQARWLDSSEMDEMVFDFEKNRFVVNIAPCAISGRQSGVLQADNLFALGDDLRLAIQVAVNKTLLEFRNRSSYTVPFVSQDVVWLIRQVLEYQRLYGAPPRAVKENDEPTRRATRNQTLSPFYPDICPLFRYREQSSFFPPSHQQITYFWGDLCAVWDEKNARWRNPKTGAIEQRPGIPQLSHKYRSSWNMPNFDLHSLRVANVSRLLDAGMPLAMVSAVAGHHSLAMTLHYFKPDGNILRLNLEKALAHCPDEFMRDFIDQLKDLKNDSWALGTAEGLARLKRARENGSIEITLSGICPGASCSTGLLPELMDGPSKEVPGSRCPLCQYHIYGTPFLLGLIFDHNCLLHALKRKADKQAEIREMIINAEDQGLSWEATRLRGEDDRIDLETALDLRELSQLTRMIDECTAKLNASSGTHPEIVTYFSANTRLEAVIERVSSFEELKDLLEASDILGTTRHQAPALAELEMRDIILNFLKMNGTKCVLAGLSKKDARRVTLQFARLLEGLVPDVDMRSKLLDGTLMLEELPDVKEKLFAAVDHIEQTTEVPRLVPAWKDNDDE